MYYTEMNPLNNKKIFVEKDNGKKQNKKILSLKQIKLGGIKIETYCCNRWKTKCWKIDTI